MKKFYILLLTLIFGFGLQSLIAQDWEQVSSLPSSFQTHHSYGFALNGKGYIVTGAVGVQQISVDNFYEYNPSSDEWTALPDFPSNRSFGIGTTLDGKAYFGFGYDNINDRNDLWVFDPNTGDWTSLANCPCTGRIHPAMVAVNGKIYVGLGSDGFGNLDDWWEYDVATDSWTQKTDFPAFRRHHPYQFALGDFVYVGNGHGNNSISNEWYRYDPSTDSWTQMATLPAEGRVAGAQFAYNGKGYIISGEGDDHGPMPTGEFWEYDPALDSWSAMPPHPGQARWAPASFVLNDAIYIINGMVRGFPNSDYISEVYKFVLDTNAIDTMSTVGINTLNNFQDLKIYPNPTNGLISVRGSNDELSTLAVLNMLGQEVTKNVTVQVAANRAIIDLSALKTGVYYVKTTSGMGKVSKL